MVTVLETKEVWVAFCLAANFRDLFIKHYNFFPLFGALAKDSGKSGFVLAFRLYHNLNH
jgi:hypothetical protein